MRLFMLCLSISLAGAIVTAQEPAPPTQPSLSNQAQALERAVEQLSGHCTAEQCQTVVDVARPLGVAFQAECDRSIAFELEPMLTEVQKLVDIKLRADACLARLIQVRQSLVQQNQMADRETLRAYLRCSVEVVDLTGRINFGLVELMDEAAFLSASQQPQRERFVDLLTVAKCQLGAQVMSWALIDPPADNPNGAAPASYALKVKLLQLIASTRCAAAVPVLARYLTNPQTTPDMILLAADTLRHIGLPQDPRPEDPPHIPRPSITAQPLADILQRLNPAVLSEPQQKLRNDLLAWATERAEKGLTENVYRLGEMELQPGDWLLMKNPSPYNRFTDLSPGLFTHVGIVTVEKGSDGKRRMVIVDLPERGSHMPATNVEAYVMRTLHYTFLRHESHDVAHQMAQAAASLIGNETEFDLTFRTERVEKLRGQPLAGKKIKTYCAGLLLLCSLETKLPRSEFFPLPEAPAAGKTLHNMHKLGLDMGDDFISPTGPLFARRMQIVGRREAMYEPNREIEEAVFDYFADSLIEKELTPTADLFQSLRTKMAEAAQNNPLLAQALAAAANVSSSMDLVAAAKTGAVVETLDEVAYAHSRLFRESLLSLEGDTAEDLTQRGFPPETVRRILSHRETHAALWHLAQQGQLTPSAARRHLIPYYIRLGRQQIDARFFSPN